MEAAEGIWERGRAAAPSRPAGRPSGDTASQPSQQSQDQAEETTGGKAAIRTGPSHTKARREAGVAEERTLRRQQQPPE